MWPLELIVMVILAALVSQLIRLKDYPAEAIGAKELKALLIGLLYALVAVFVGAWLMMDQGMEMLTLMSFLIMVSIGVSGMAFVSGLLDFAKGLMPKPELKP